MGGCARAMPFVFVATLLLLVVGPAVVAGGMTAGRDTAVVNCGELLLVTLRTLWGNVPMEGCGWWSTCRWGCCCWATFTLLAVVDRPLVVIAPWHSFRWYRVDAFWAFDVRDCSGSTCPMCGFFLVVDVNDDDNVRGFA